MSETGKNSGSSGVVGIRDDARRTKRIGAGFGTGSKPKVGLTQAKGFGNQPLSLLQLAYDLGGEEEIKRPFEQNPWVHAALKVFAEAVSSVDFVLWASDDDKAERVSDTDTLAKLLRRPNPLMSSATFFAASLYHRRLDGEDFWFLADKHGQPLKTAPGMPIPEPEQIWPVRGSVVEPVYNDVKVDVEGQTEGRRVQVGWKYTDSAGNDSKTWPIESVIHFRDYDPENMKRGIGDVDALSRSMTLQFQAERYLEGLLRNSGDPGGFVELAEDEDLSAEEQERVEGDINDAFGNPVNRGEWKVIGKGRKYTANSINPKDMEFKELLLHQRDIILAVIGVPPPLVGVYDNAHFNNIKEAKKALWTGGNGVLGYLHNVEETIRVFFLERLKDSRKSRYVGRFDVSSIEALREDNTEKIKTAAEVTGKGIGVPFDEALALVGVEAEPVTNGKVGYVNPGLVSSDSVGSGGEGDEPGDARTDVGDTGSEPSSSASGQEGTPGGEEIPTAGLSLNGSQISSVTEIVHLVSTGDVPRDAGHGMLMILFGLSAEDADKVLGSAGKGTSTKPNKPDGGEEVETEEEKPNALQEAVDGEGGDDDGDASKSKRYDHSVLTLDALAELRSTNNAVWRFEFWRRIEKRLLEPGEKAVKDASAGYLRDYFDAQMKRLRKIAGGGKAFHRYSPIFDQEFKSVTPNQVAEALLLDEEEWAKKMSKKVGPQIAKIYAAALADAVEEMGGVLLGVTDPKVAAKMAAQDIKLTEGVTSTLAKKVKKVALKTLANSDGVNLGTVQQAIASVLPDLEGALKQAFTDIDSRALAIARTETGQAANSSRFLHMAENDIEEHEWISADDGEVREQHRYPLGDGVIVKVGEAFPNGLLHPHDPGADASQVVNCRCTTAAVIKVPTGDEPES